MIKAMRQKHTKGFTLIELLVVIAIIGILAALLFPAISKALLTAQGSALASNGRGIHQMIFAASVKNDGLASAGIEVLNAYPVSGHPDYTTSTKYFEWAVKTNILTNIDFTFFAGKDVPATASLANFTADNNAWCIVADLSDDSPANAPFIFTRNIECTPNDISGVPTLSATLTPFRNRQAVIITKGGSSKVLPGDLFTADTFNPPDPITGERFAAPILLP